MLPVAFLYYKICFPEYRVEKMTYFRIKFYKNEYCTCRIWQNGS